MELLGPNLASRQLRCWPAGKGGVVRRLGWALDPRSFRVHAITAPTRREKSRHYLQRSFVMTPSGLTSPGTLTFADPPHRFGKYAQLNRMNCAVGAAQAARSDKIAGFDVTETPLLNPINLRIGG